MPVAIRNILLENGFPRLHTQARNDTGFGGFSES